MRFRDAFVVVSGGLCGVCVESPAPCAPFSFFLRLYEAGHTLQPKGGEHMYLSSRRSIDPRGPASNRGAAPAVKIRVVRYGSTKRPYLRGMGRGCETNTMTDKKRESDIKIDRYTDI